MKYQTKLICGWTAGRGGKCVREGPPKELVERRTFIRFRSDHRSIRSVCRLLPPDWPKILRHWLHDLLSTTSTYEPVSDIVLRPIDNSIFNRMEKSHES